jgi:hypothetical protein
MTTLGWPHPGIDQALYAGLVDDKSGGPINLTARASDDSAFDPGEEHSRENSGEQAYHLDGGSRLGSIGEHHSCKEASYLWSIRASSKYVSLSLGFSSLQILKPRRYSLAV